MQNSTHYQVFNDHRKNMPLLLLEESRVAIECSMRIKAHLEKAWEETQDPKFAQRLEIIEGIIAEYRDTMVKGKPAFSGWNLGLAS